MRPLYLLAVVGTRLIGIVLMLTLTYLMAPPEFGQFALINTNALLIQMLVGSWLVSIANRELVSDEGVVNSDIMSSVTSAGILVAAIVLCVGAAYAFYHYEQRWQVLGTAALAVVLIVYDITLAAKNAIGRETAYASFAVYRNVLTFGLSVSLVAFGMGAFGPVVGLVMGTVAPLFLLSSARSVWAGARASWIALARARQYTALGVSGGLILGVYILVNAPTRNIIAHHLGKAPSGVWTLCGDLFYGPLAVIGNAYALSQVRLMYLAAANSDSDALNQRSRSLVEFIIAITVPYVIGSVLFASDAMVLVLSRSQALLASEIAPYAAVQGAAILLLYSLASIALARRRLRLIATMVISTALSATAATFAGNTLAEMASYSMAGTLVSALCWLTWSSVQGIVQIRLGELGKLFIAGAAMWLAATISLHMVADLGGGWMLAAVASAVSFVAVAVGLRIHGFIEVLPSRMRERIVRGIA